MENIILKLIEIEDAAGKILEEAETGENGCGRSVDQVRAEIEARINAETEAKIAEINKNADEDIKHAVVEIENTLRKKQDAIKRVYYENHESVEDDIVSSIKRFKC